MEWLLKSTRGGRGIATIDHQVIGEAGSQLAYRTRQETLSGGVRTVARSIRFGIKRERQTGAHHTDAGQLMAMADHFLFSITLGTTQSTAWATAPPGRGSINR
jgi:hypothetical protein